MKARKRTAVPSWSNFGTENDNHPAFLVLSASVDRLWSYSKWESVGLDADDGRESHGDGDGGRRLTSSTQ